MRPSIAELVRTKRVIVCGGSGGVGKTTTATAIAIAAAREGRKVLALTVDPSKRLAQTLGVDRNAPTPRPVSEERLREAGVQAPGTIEAWMLDPSVVADRLVERLAPDPNEAARLKKNRIYRQLSRLVAGTQEYMAMEALYRFLDEGRYDLIVLDTPPSRNALDFLLGPGRVAAFADGRIFQLFVPSESRGIFRAAAASLLTRLNSAIFGEQTYKELQEFFATFAHIIVGINRNASAMLKTLQNPDQVAFLLVSSPAAEALTEAFYFRRKCLEMDLPFRGFVLNRSEARQDGRVWPDDALFGGSPDAVEQAALSKLQRLARLEMAQVERDRGLLQDLAAELGEEAVAIAVPALAHGAHDMEALTHIAGVLMEDDATAVA